MALDNRWFDELRARTTLSALIGRSVKVQKAGREYKACCPFHNEKTPSFTINDEKGFYHCFGCGAHGDVIKWMTDHQGLPFMDAIKQLASEAGMEVPASDPKAAKRKEKRDSLFDVMTAAAAYFQEELQRPGGAIARDYLLSRGVRDNIIARFGMGFAPNDRQAIKVALSQFKEESLIEAGLLIKVDDKEPYARFRGRLMIPILDQRGRCIAFGGRILGDGEPKYLNSPDTPLFDKGRTLYNLNIASTASRQSDRIIAVEGYMDAIALAQSGIDDVVAPLGTAMTENQLMMMWRLVDKPLLCFDGDAAGQKAAMRAASRALPLLKPGKSLRFIQMPAGMDPDDVVNNQGKKVFDDLVNNASSLLDKIWEYEKQSQPLDGPEDKAGLKQRLGVYLSAIADADIKGHYREAFDQKLSDLFKRPQQIYQQNNQTGRNFQRFDPKKPNWKRQNSPPSSAVRTIASKGSDILMSMILGSLLRDTRLIPQYFESLLELHPSDELDAQILNALINVNDSKERLDSDAIYTILGEKLYNRASSLLRADSMNLVSSNGNIAKDDKSEGHKAGFLGEAIDLYCRKPKLEESLRLANLRAAQAQSDAEFEQAGKDVLELANALRELEQKLADILIASAND
ncbi:DNA primase [Sphingorhabdus lutea]|uniref:DNA primase n=1 Tax=Sphingorhabdus lutea TaxID=1913578 RepID=A0A1L3JC89_9SPHN|nr:DNA primase [Sphingorhabdus lutea]APG62746.1 DNA primase [Sphingorhabdus lutea]